MLLGTGIFMLSFPEDYIYLGAHLYLSAGSLSGKSFKLLIARIVVIS